MPDFGLKTRHFLTDKRYNCTKRQGNNDIIITRNKEKYILISHFSLIMVHLAHAQV